MDKEKRRTASLPIHQLSPTVLIVSPALTTLVFSLSTSEKNLHKVGSIFVNEVACNIVQ